MKLFKYLSAGLLLISNSHLAQTECTSPMSITPSVSNGCNGYTSYDVGALSATIPLPPCANPNFAGDSWYSFVPNDSTAEIRVSSSSGSPTGGDCSIAVYSGCNAADLIQCENSSAATNGLETMNIGGLTPGQTYYVRVMNQEKSSGNPKYTGTGSICIISQYPTPFELNGSAYSLPDSCVQLTPALMNQSGCAWSDGPMNFAQPFDYTFTVNLGSNDSGADGITFIIQNTGNGSAQGCGSSGGGIGAGGITPSLIIEFDTWQNGAGDPLNAPWEPVCDHIAVETDGTLISDVPHTSNTQPAFGPVQASSTNCNIEDGLDHTIQITYNPATNLFEIYFDGVLRLSFNFDVAAHLGSNFGTWGLAASTGFQSNSQSFCPGQLPVTPLPVELVAFQANLEQEGAVKVNWKTLTEFNNDHFIIERSHDGLDWQKIVTVKGMGSTTETTNYDFMDFSAIPGLNYYRLIQVDIDGRRTTSEAVTVEINPEYSGSFLLYPNPTDGKFTCYTQLHGEFNLKIINYAGRIVEQTIIEFNNNPINIDITQLPDGVYTIHLENSDLSENLRLIKTKL